MVEALVIAELKVEDLKLDNILVNHGEGNLRVSEAQLVDHRGAYSSDSTYAKEGIPVGAGLVSLRQPIDF